MTTIIYLDEYQIFILSAVQAEFEDSSIGDYVTQSFTADSVTFLFWNRRNAIGCERATQKTWNMSWQFDNFDRQEIIAKLYVNNFIILQLWEIILVTKR